MTFGKAVIINGGDTYVAEYRERYGAIDQIMTGVNQESVWSSIDFDSGTFREQTSETRDYFCKYLETCKADGVEVYLLEYTTNQKLIQKIKEYCKEWTAITEVDTKKKPGPRITRHYAALLRISNGVYPAYMQQCICRTNP